MKSKKIIIILCVVLVVCLGFGIYIRERVYKHNDMKAIKESTIKMETVCESIDIEEIEGFSADSESIETFDVSQANDEPVSTIDVFDEVQQDNTQDGENILGDTEKNRENQVDNKMENQEIDVDEDNDPHVKDDKSTIPHAADDVELPLVEID